MLLHTLIMAHWKCIEKSGFMIVNAIKESCHHRRQAQALTSHIKHQAIFIVGS